LNLFQKDNIMDRERRLEQIRHLDQAIDMTFSDDLKVQDEGIKMLEKTSYERQIALFL